MQWAGKWNVAIEELFPLVSVKLLDEQDAKRPVTILLEKKKKKETKQFQYLVFFQTTKTNASKIIEFIQHVIYCPSYVEKLQEKKVL